ncbi:CBS domain-containing protein [Magnetovibrio blakemorei]|uniref:CBS domain-containing protein n=1 Tax=Magnetovibrio blakemorei TaxID=28181 RepID=A0A1E5Q5W3_9PROT|nr:CBS domain-containing protein [Magnetovibrio blakemorei]OEJ65983.1 hypothetical protein BEN30_13385 [Magnetovibrio blakemorei]
MIVKTILDEKGPELIKVKQTDSVRMVAQVFKAERIGFALVDDSANNHVGTISERDIVQAIADGGNIEGMIAKDVMTQNVVSVGPEETIETVRDIMTARRTRHVLVKDEGLVVGVVSIGDVIKHSLAECQIDTGQLREYITGTGYQ